MKNILFMSLLVLTLFILNKVIFSNQLNYGFRDIDWMSLYYYKYFGPLSLDHLLQTVRMNGAYTHQVYYVGFLEQIFGLNFRLLHQSSQIFKVLSALTLYFLIISIFKNKLLAFLTSFLYTISYTHAGPLFQLSTGSYFPGVILMNFFLLTYWIILVKNKNLALMVLASMLFMAALFTTTERMYPLLFLILLIEFLFISFNKFKIAVIKLAFRRIFFIFLPPVILFFVQIFWLKNSIASSGFAPSQFFIGMGLLVDGIIKKGNWQLLLYPFASFGSLFLHGEWWKYLGIVSVSNFTSYLAFLIFGPILKLSILSIFLLYFISKNFLRSTSIILFFILGFGLLAYAVIANWKNLDSSLRIHFDANLVLMPAIFGFFIILISFLIFIEWVKYRNYKLAPLIVGPVFSLLFILLTWIATDLQLVFLGTQRYLSIPSIGASIFIAGFMVVIYDKLRKLRFTKQFAWLIFLSLIPLILINRQVTNDFFNYELNYAGMRADDQTRMKDNFRSLALNINKNERTLFYFDETPDHSNGYFDESTVMAGFEFWTRVNSDGDIEYFPDPGMLRTNVQCPKVSHQSCIQFMKKGLTVINGEQGIVYRDHIRTNEPIFYKLKNFYAFRFINKHLVSIKDEVLIELLSE